MHLHSGNNVKIVDTILVNRILEQGQKLRNAMVGSILKNDPFNTDIIYSKHFNTPKTSSINLNSPKSDSVITSVDEKRLEAYIKGEYMTKDEEKLALDTLRSMSAPDLYKTTERSLNSNCSSSCKCYTCEIYNSDNLYCDLRRKNKTRVDRINVYPSSDVARGIQERYNNENRNLLKYVDSLKVSINNLTLNETGNRKVTDNDSKVPYNFNQTYFLEYNIPDCMFNKSTNKSKVNSGLDSNYVRFCSRRSNDVIHFKQITIHDVKNLDKLNLDECEIQFKISYRTQKQKNVSTLGYAKFNLGSFLLSKNLVCSRNLLVHLNETSPIIVGNLKISLSLGCGKLYFGQEFIDAICSVNSDAVVLDSDDSTNLLNSEEPEKINLIPNKQIEENDQIFEESAPKTNTFSKPFKKRTNETVPKSAIKTTEREKIVKPFRNITSYKNKHNQIDKNEIKISTNDVVISGQINDGIKSQISEKEKQVLFGFLYISEVQYLSPPINTYITCRPFCQSETSCSKLITNSSNPIFNFTQLIPLIYEDELLQLFRENYMVIEFWEKIDSTDIVIGLSKISLHQFYLAYRSPVFVKYLSKNKLPVIDTDWWEPIYRVETNRILGQVQILVALGTEDQVNNLKTDRGFANNIVKAKFTPSQYNTKFESKIADEFIRKPFSSYKFRQEANENNTLRRKNQVRFKQDTDVNKLREFTTQTSISLEEQQFVHSADKAVNTSPKTGPICIQKSNIGTQSNLTMDKTVESQDKDQINPTQEMLGTFLNQLMAQRQKNVCVENSTNTDIVETVRSNCSENLQNAQQNTDLKLKKTTDLLDSLQKALSLDSVSDAKINEKKPGTFKASITIESANHLPSRKKCKSKKSRNRSIKNDDNVLPSCYVTFETSESDLKITPVVMKSTNPVWNYKCNVHLLEDLLTNGQRRLIFKVWRKATNTVLTSNMQTDVVLGFAAVDLSVLLAGFPNVKGWFNIIDFTGKCNGQINIHISPLENLSKYSARKEECNCNTTETVKKDSAKIDDEPSELFSRALKRKFTELDEITQRLRLRLSKVTNDDSDASSDAGADDFDRDINTLCIEEDFDLIDFAEEAKKLNMNHRKENVASNECSTSRLQTLLTIEENDSSKGHQGAQMTEENKTSGSNTASSLCQDAGSVLGLSSSSSEKEKELSTLDKHLQEGKQKIDTLLEKLSLISADTNSTFASRYVSGCSLNNDCNALSIDTEAILKELDHSSRPNIQSSLGFEPLNFQQLYGGSCDSNSSKKSGCSITPTSNSDTSLITNFSDSRPAPDGQGNVSDERVVKK